MAERQTGNAPTQSGGLAPFDTREAQVIDLASVVVGSLPSNCLGCAAGASSVGTPGQLASRAAWPGP